MPRLKSQESHVYLTSDDASWIVSFYVLGCAPGNLIAAFLVEWLGRKSSLLISGIPLTLGWILIIVAWNPYVLYASRFISGLGLGIVYVVVPMYIGEIADKEIRGILGSFIKLMSTFGELYARAIGPFVSYDVLSYSCMLINIAFFLSFVWMPESPYYLLMKNKQDEAMKNLKRLKCNATEEELEEEMNQIQKTVIHDLTDKAHFWDLFYTRGNRRAVVVSFGLQLILQFSGIAAIESYTEEILHNADTELSAGIAVIILSVIQLIAGLCATALVDRVGRKPLLLITTLFSGVFLTIAGAFYFMKFNTPVDMANYGWILHASVIAYELIIALGLNPLPYVMLGELFPTNVKGTAVSLVNIWGSLLAFVAAKLYQVIGDSLGMHTVFGWFAVTCFLGIIFIVFLVPETKGKSLLEIQEELNCTKKQAAAKKKKQEEIYISTLA